MRNLHCFSFVYLLLVLRTPLSKASRDKRFIIVNPTAPMTLGFLGVFGFQFILPTLAPVNNPKRSLDSEPSKTTFVDPSEEEFPENLQMDTGYIKQAQRLIFIFEYLEIYTISCQERIICEIAADANFYEPLSEVILRDMKQRHGPVTKSQKFLMWRYIMAAQLGLNSSAEKCGQEYSKCSRPAHQFLNMAVIKVWQYIASKTNIKILGIR